MKEYKHKTADFIAVKHLSSQYTIYDKESKYVACIPTVFIENSCDWEEVEEKKPLFRTADGVDIYPGHTVYGVSKRFGHVSSFKWTSEKDFHPYKSLSEDIKYFSTLQQAEKYKFDNTVFFSIQDLKNTINLTVRQEVSLQILAGLRESKK